MLNLTEVMDERSMDSQKGKMKKSEFKKKLREAILAERALKEAKKGKKEEEDTEEEDVDIDLGTDGEDIDLNLDGEEGIGDTKVDMNMDTTGDVDAGSSESKKAFSELTDAYRAAKELGDEKLIRQIANTITYFNKNIILSQG
jgi:16S rRNA C1402 N4-methylase RsmH